MMGKLSGRGVLVWLGAFFGIIIATNVYFITLSVRTFSGEDEGDPYLQGLEYDRTLAARAEQARIGWHATISSRRLQSGKVEIIASIVQADGTPEKAAALRGELRHPADENRDRSLAFTERAPGTYVAEPGNIAAGAWDVLVNNQGKTPFQASRRIWLP
jgi:nitrogen fixation protein FixH